MAEEEDSLDDREAQFLAKKKKDDEAEAARCKRFFFLAKKKDDEAEAARCNYIVYIYYVCI
jgi:hypothetical protein